MELRGVIEREIIDYKQFGGEKTREQRGGREGKITIRMPANIIKNHIFIYLPKVTIYIYMF